MLWTGRRQRKNDHFVWQCGWRAAWGRDSKLDRHRKKHHSPIKGTRLKNLLRKYLLFFFLLASSLHEYRQYRN